MIILTFSALATFWSGILLFLGPLAAVILTWIVSGLLLILQKIFKDNDGYKLVKINIYYGAIIFFLTFLLTLFFNLLSDSSNLWVERHLSIIEYCSILILVPIFVWFSIKVYRGLMGLPIEVTKQIKPYRVITKTRADN